MKKNREVIALFIAFVLGSFLLGFIASVDLLTTATYLVPAIFIIYLGKHFVHSSSEIFKKPTLGFPSKDLWYIFFGSQILKTIISYVLRDSLESVLSIGLVEWIVIVLEVVSFGALIILLSKLIIKIIPQQEQA